MWLVRQQAASICLAQAHHVGQYQVTANGCFAHAQLGRDRSLRQAAMENPDRPVRIDHCRPRTSAVRWLNFGVSFPAVKSLVRLSLAGPQLTFRILGSCRTAKPRLYAFRIQEAAARGHRDPASSSHTSDQEIALPMTGSNVSRHGSTAVRRSSISEAIAPFTRRWSASGAGHTSAVPAVSPAGR